MDCQRTIDAVKAGAGSRWMLLAALFTVHGLLFVSPVMAQSLTLVELNCENLFDTLDDSLQQDEEYLPDATRHWTRKRFRRKLVNIAQELLSCRDDGIPDFIALCEVENDSVMYHLTRRSPLRNAGYQYLMTNSPDVRGIDVALLYNPASLSVVAARSLRVEPVRGMRPTRDILFVSGRLITGDTLHVFVVHAPSRYGGEAYSRPFRMAVARRLCLTLDSLTAANPQALIVAAGDFNDETDSPALQLLAQHGLCDVTRRPQAPNHVKGTYRYQGQWSSIDHVLCSPPLAAMVDTAYIHAPAFLLDDETAYGGYKPRRTYNGMRYQPGYSDHLPLVVRLRTDK